MLGRNSAVARDVDGVDVCRDSRRTGLSVDLVI